MAEDGVHRPTQMLGGGALTRFSSRLDRLSHVFPIRIAMIENPTREEASSIRAGCASRYSSRCRCSTNDRS
jgi:hypothetical protein